MTATGSFISLFSGCGGLDLAFESQGWTCVAQVENDKDCAAVLKQRFPGVPNLGDITEVDWSQAPQADGIVGGFPCQDLSYAGRGAGLDGDRSGLWFPMMDAIRAVRPKRVVVENVPGLLGRGLHVVTHDLARAGYVGTWRTLAAADMGAPHRRERVFVVARLEEANADVAGQSHLLGEFTEDGWTSLQETLLGVELLDHLPKAGAWTRERIYEFELAETEDGILASRISSTNSSVGVDSDAFGVGRSRIQPDARLYLPGRKWFAQRTLSRVAATLLPTPGANDATGAEGETRDARRDAGDTGGPSLRDLPRLLPTPTASDGAGGGRDARLLPTPRVEASRSSRKALVENQQWSAPSLEQAVEIAQGILPREFDSWDQVKGKDHPSEGAAAVEWGDYEPAIRRWETILGRPAPLPTDKGRLSPAFVEWMLGLPEGWVQIEGAKRTAQLRMLGNAVQVQVAQVVALWLAELGDIA